VLAYGSKVLNPAQQNNCTTKRELFAVVHFVQHYKHYLLGRKFIIRSDHKSLLIYTNWRNQREYWLARLAFWVLMSMTLFTEIMAFAIPNHTAYTVADILVTQVFLQFGFPSQSHTDQGREFESHLFSHICSLLGIDKTRTIQNRMD
jgi:hypothetical protein